MRHLMKGYGCACGMSDCRRRSFRAGEEGGRTVLGQGQAEGRGRGQDGAGRRAAGTEPVDKLPKLKVPAGFKVEVYQSGILDARGLRGGDKGTIFVSSLFVAGKIYAITRERREERGEDLA